MINESARAFLVLTRFRTAQNHIRPAGNSWHLVDYDPNTGAVLEVCNCPQGLDQINGMYAVSNM